jgi:methionine-R-sulfoxide reductase/methionine-S-sulfoxide reductase
MKFNSGLYKQAAVLFLLIFAAISCTKSNSYNNYQNSMNSQDSNKYNKLTEEEERVILHKGTERPFTGEYYENHRKGTYICKRCDAKLYRSEMKFESGCGWPSFDDAIPGAVKQIPDADGMRVEILCNNCGAHLGHVFYGEGFTAKDTRYCVNSISMKFIPDSDDVRIAKAVFASGCFWGTEYYMMKANGVISTRVGFTRGIKENPTYEEVCSGSTHHLEAVEITYDENKTTYENLVKLFFETHDFTQTDGQGPDIGEQYKSAIFYSDDNQKKTAEKYIGILKDKGYKVATELRPASTFWQAEDYHQKYYQKNGKMPYCHIYKKIFD